MQQVRPDGHRVDVGDFSTVYGRVHPQEAAILQRAAAAQRSRVQLLDPGGQLLQKQQTLDLYGTSYGTGSDNLAV